VDAVSRSEFWDMLGKLRQYNITIIVSTPYMDEAIRCDRVALIQNGKILSIDTPQKIREGFSKKLFTVKASEKYRLINVLRKNPGVLTAYPFGDSIHVTLADEGADKILKEYLVNEGIVDAVIQEAAAGIEDRFLELMEKE
jgi:ABC-type multidrug transport system ATPase subunit